MRTDIPKQVPHRLPTNEFTGMTGMRGAWFKLNIYTFNFIFTVLPFDFSSNRYYNFDSIRNG
jgi:hypothetical protein